MDEGIQRGVWDASRNPLVGVTIPRSQRTAEDGRPDLSMIPTDDQVIGLIIRMASDRPVYGVMAATAAFTGVRWGELLAITVDSVRLDIGRLRVTHNCQLVLCRPTGPRLWPPLNREGRTPASSALRREWTQFSSSDIRHRGSWSVR